MASDLSLLFELRASNAQAKAVMADTRAAVAQLRTQFGGDLKQMQGVARTAISDIGENVNAFVGQRIPLIGGTFLRITSNLRGLNDEMKKGGPETAKLARQIDEIAKASGKSTTEVSRFLTSFVRLEGQAKRDAAALEFVGATAAQKLIPQLEQAGTQLTTVAASAEGAGGAVAGLAHPVGIVVIALTAMAIGAAAAAKQLFDLTKQAADFQGRMADLAQQTGLTVETLSALEVVAKTTGGELGSITQAIVLFQRKLDDAQDPLSKTAEQFRKFKIETSDTENALRQAFTALAAMPPGFAQTNAAAEFFGARGGKQVLAILKETNGDLDATIKRLRDLGVLIDDDAARAADRFNDELALLNFQIRALGAAAAKDLIPAMVEVVRGMGQLVTAIRPVVSLLGSFAGPVVRSVGDGLKNLSILVRLATGDYKALAEAIKKAREEREINPLDAPDVTPVALPGAPTPQQTTSEAVNQTEVVLAEIRRRVASHNQALDSLFQQGRRDRQQQAEDVIAGNRRILKAEQDRIDATLAKKEQELRALDQAQRDRGEAFNRDTDAYRAVTAEIIKLQQERLDKEAEFDTTSRAIRAKAAKERADSTRNQIQNETDLLLGEFDAQIKAIEAAVKRGDAEEESSLTTIEQLERAKVDARIEGLERQRDVGFLTVQEQKDLNNELQKLQQERDRLDDEQSQRRLERERATGQRAIDVAIANLDTLLSLEQSAGQRRIETLQGLADLRVLTEEQAARKILQIRLDLLDDEIEVTKEKLKAAGTIADKDERIRTQAELNNQLKILTAERAAIQADGNRTIDEGRQRDLENERQYADELRSIQERIVDIQRDTARTVIELMEASFARRRDIIRAEAELEIQDAEDRLRRNREDIRGERETVNERLAALRGFLTSLESSNQIEIAAYARVVQARVDALNQQRDLNNQERAELAQHQTLLAAIRETTAIGDFRSVIEARVRVLEQQRELNIAEQAELEQHQEILQALREREARASRVGVIEARINVLQRQSVLNNEEQEELRQHQAELQRIREQDSDLTGAIQRRVDFLNSQKELNAQEEAELKRNVAILKVINEGGPSLEASIRARVESLERQTDLNAEEQAELKQHKAILDRLSDRSQSYADAIQKRAEFLQRQKELNAEEKAELERHEKELELIRRRARLDEKEADPLGRITLDIDNLKEFARVIEDSIVPLADILRNSFLQVADAIGQTVANWVLLGETGPAVMRKILAQALASLAAEAAVNAVKELALGFATLFFNPAESAAHFTAAGLWTAIGGVAAVAGRGVAGDLFKPKTSGAGGAGTSSDDRGQLDPLRLERNTGNREMVLKVVLEQQVKSNDSHIVKTVVKDIQSGGNIREVINTDGVLV